MFNKCLFSLGPLSNEFPKNKITLLFKLFIKIIHTLIILDKKIKNTEETLEELYNLLSIMKIII